MLDADDCDEGCNCDGNWLLDYFEGGWFVLGEPTNSDATVLAVMLGFSDTERVIGEA